MSNSRPQAARWWWHRPKVVAIFAASPGDATAAVQYIRREVPSLPIWLFTIAEPEPQIRSLCERVIVEPEGRAFLRKAREMTRSNWVALGLTAWTGRRDEPWQVKAAPLLTPPFRTLVMNEHGGFFPPTPLMLVRHGRERAWTLLTSSETSLALQMEWHRVKVRVWGRGIVIKDRLLYLWRWWPVLLREWWTPIRVRLVYQLFFEWVGALLSTWQRVKDVYWAIADPYEKRGFSLYRLLDGLGRRVWGAPLQKALARLYPRVQQRFAKYAATPRPINIAVPNTGVVGRDIDIFHYFGKRWSRASLQELAETSSARCLLLVREGADAGDVQALLPLFDDPSTFAAAWQTETRAWDRSLFCRAPFRPLQSGEVSPVLAPVAPAILVDRAKLQALGAPSALFSLTAMLLLFWKANATGWLSYHVGSDRAVVPAWRWPAEESEAALRLMVANSGVPDTRETWGNTAFAMDYTRLTRREKPLRVLVVSPYLPYPLSHGGAVRIYNLCKALASEVEFVLASFREKADVVQYDKLHEVFREVYVVDRDEPLSPDETLPMQVRGQQSRGMEALVERLCRTQDIDIVQIEYTHLANLRPHAGEVPAILVEHDITFSLYQQLAEQTPNEANRSEHGRWLKYERHWLTKFDAVWTMSPADRELAVQNQAPSDKTWVVPNGVDVARFQPESVETAAPEIFFVGSFRHYPNILGFERLWREMMPDVWREFPDARLRVVAGPEPEHYWALSRKNEPYPAAQDERLILHGFVEDLRPLYARAAVVAIPLLVSAGTNIKLMEAMACGKAIVSSSIGCAGLDLLDGEDLLIRDHVAEFADALRELLLKPAERKRLSTKARQTAEQRFSWTRIATQAYESYAQLLSAKKSTD